MTRETYRVAFQPEGRSVFVLRGTKIIEAAGQAGIILSQPCGGEGTCGKCRVEVLGDCPEPTPSDRRALTPEQLGAGWRLACQLAVVGNMVISVPRETRFFEQMVLTEGPACRYPLEPNLRKKFLRVPEATTEDQRSDLARLRQALGEGEAAAELALIQALPSMLRQADHRVTAVLEGDGIQWVEAGDTTDRIWGLALDVGTTTIVGTLMNLLSGRAAAIASRTNPQVHFGDDVVTRISYIERTRDGLARMRRRLLDCLREMVTELCEGAQVEPESVYEATIVGNTTMTHILLGVDPSPIAHAPYVAVFRQPVDAKARELGLEINRNANLHVLPNIAGFVGSDTVGVVLASGMAREPEVRLAIDIGTNGEVVIGNRDRLLACSCAAGPALEGARIRHGMRATDGAISKVVVNDAVEVGVIGGGRPIGICGSGLIDAVAQFLDAGLIEPTGRMVDPQQAGDLPDGLRRLLMEQDGQPAVVLVAGARTKTGEPILLTQRDVREVQLASAAIRAGIGVLADEFGVEFEDLHSVLLAGGFGNFIRRSRAKRMGLLPLLPTERIEFIGNAAFAGAKAALLCRSSREEAEWISRRTEYVELAGRRDFHQLYMEAMEFPKG
jgi:uncharacterized 2Fe-2S/4Fe-4S cluster protein (DUF4445 family)